MPKINNNNKVHTYFKNISLLENAGRHLTGRTAGHRAATHWGLYKAQCLPSATRRAVPDSPGAWRSPARCPRPPDFAWGARAPRSTPRPATGQLPVSSAPSCASARPLRRGRTGWQRPLHCGPAQRSKRAEGRRHRAPETQGRCQPREPFNCVCVVSLSPQCHR